MPKSATLSVTTPSDREIVMTREFDALRALVWQALTTPDLLKRWLLGPPGWTMTVCDITPRVGTSYRYEWRKDDGTTMGMGGTIKEAVLNLKLVATERFDQAWYPGEGLVSWELSEQGGRTTVTTTLRYESKEARDAVAKSGATSGMEMGYARLEGVLTELIAEGVR